MGDCCCDFRVLTDPSSRCDDCACCRDFDALGGWCLWAAVEGAVFGD